MPDQSLALLPPVEKAIAQRFGKMVARSLDVLEVVDRTNELPRDSKTGALIKPPGMDDATFHLHCDAMVSNRNMPAYLASHMRRAELAQKIAGDKSGDLPKIAVAVVHTWQPREYETVDVTVVDKE